MCLCREVHHISIHVPREGDDVRIERNPNVDEISIHVPREGDDLGALARV